MITHLTRLPRHQWDLARSFLEHGVVRFDEKDIFILKNGPPDWLYFDVRLVGKTKFGGGITLQLGKSIIDHLQDLVELNGINFDAIAGVPDAGDPFAEMLGSVRNKPVIRLKKDRGSSVEGFLMNPSPRGSTVLVIENVTRSGISATNTIGFLKNAGYMVGDVLSIVDRESGAGRLLGLEGIRLTPVMKMGDLLDFYIHADEIPYELCERAKARALQLTRRLETGSLQ